MCSERKNELPRNIKYKYSVKRPPRSRLMNAMDRTVVSIETRVSQL